MALTNRESVMATTSAEKEPIACAKRIGIHASNRMELADLVWDGFPCTAFLSWKNHERFKPAAGTPGADQ
jgi:hypothetical protein